jgi:hypothetical protein
MGIELLGTLADWSSVTQLLCAYALVIRGYGEYKEKTNEAAGKMLEEASARMETLLRDLPERGTRSKPKLTQFHWLKWHEIPLPELNDHRKFLTTWYYNRTQAQKVSDGRRHRTLICVGAIAFTILMMTAALKDVAVNPLIGTAVALAMWVPVFTVMIETWREDMELRTLISLSEKPAEEQDPSPSPFPGMIYAVTNHIRRLHATKSHSNRQDPNTPSARSA